MVSIKEIRASNAALSKTHTSLTAVFVGATAGIGLATLRAFARNIPKPHAIIIGRSRTKFEPELQNLKHLNSEGEYTFLEADVSLIKNIDAVCEEIKAHLSSKRIDILFTSQGYISFSGRENNADGLDNSISLRYYGRIRFTENLLPLMTPEGTAVSVLAGSKEGKIFEDDLDLERNYSIPNSMGHFASLHTLAYDQLAAQNPSKGFVHTYPGFVSTGLFTNSAPSGLLGLFFRYILEPVLKLVATTPEDAGERVLYLGTSGEFARGSWAVDSDGTAKEGKVLVGYRERGMGEKVGEHNRRVFERVTEAV